MAASDIPIYDLLDSQLVDKDFTFQGDPTATLRGLTLRFAGPRLRGRFVALVTPDWGKVVHQRYGASASSLPGRIDAALKQGARGFIVPSSLKGEEPLEDVTCIFVEDTRRTTFQLLDALKAKRGRSRLTAVTGSAGKSTTKAMITHALGSLMPRREVYSPGHTQNVMTSMVGHLSVTHRFPHSVIEVAGSCFVAFQRINNFTVSPDVSIVTSISEAHLNYLGDLRGVAQLKSNLFNAPPPGGTAIINLDTSYSDLLVRSAIREGCQLVTYGESPDATIRLLHYDPESRTATAMVGREKLEYRIGPRGKHMALNSLAVIGTLRAHGISAWREAVTSLETFTALSGRGRTFAATLKSGVSITLVDETYNANPASMRAALDSLANQTTHVGSRQIAVLGDMLELGTSSTKVHLGLAQHLRRSTPHVTHFYGPEMGALYRAVKDEIPKAQYWENLESLTKHLLSTLRDNDVLLMKSANGTGLHKVVSELTQRPAPDRI